MSLLSFFQWCYATNIGETIRNSTWLFPVIEAVHLLGFGLTAGSILLVEMRLLGAGISRQPVAELAKNAEPWMYGGIDEGLLQSCVLGEDDLPSACPRVYVHAAAAGHAGRFG
jgi:hypothetical protein